MCIVHMMPQGSMEWEQARLGIPTASEFSEIITPAKLELSKSGKKYLYRKLAEWMYGAPLEAFVSPWMERGKALEAQAVRYYEMERDVETSAVGLVTTDDGMIGASPDRLVGDDGLLEQKCQALETHVGYMLNPQSLVDEYRLQVQGQLWVCERAWCDLQSYYPGFPSVIVRAEVETKVSLALAMHISAFVETMLKCRVLLQQTYGDLRREREPAKPLEVSEASFDAFLRGVV